MSREHLVINNVDLESAYKVYLTYYNVGETEPQTSYITVPGRSGKIDVTDFLGVTYSNRTITADLAAKDKYVYSAVRQYLESINGTKVTIAESGDPSIYWSGRLTLGKYDSKNGKISEFEVTVDADPFPYDSTTNEEVR